MGLRQNDFENRQDERADQQHQEHLQSLSDQIFQEFFPNDDFSSLAVYDNDKAFQIFYEGEQTKKYIKELSFTLWLDEKLQKDLSEKLNSYRKRMADEIRATGLQLQLALF